MAAWCHSNWEAFEDIQCIGLHSFTITMSLGRGGFFDGGNNRFTQICAEKIHKTWGWIIYFLFLVKVGSRVWSWNRPGKT